MSPAIWLLLAAITLVLVYVYKQYQQKHAFSKKAEMNIQVFLDQKLSENSKHYGCIIFQLPKYNEQLKEVVITNIKCTDKSIHINNFDKLNFFIVPGKSIESAKRSIGFYISRSAVKSNRMDKNSIMIKGYLTSLDNIRSNFVNTQVYQMEPMDSISSNLVNSTENLSLQ